MDPNREKCFISFKFLLFLALSFYSSLALAKLTPLTNVPESLQEDVEEVREMRLRHLPPKVMQLADAALQAYFDAGMPTNALKIEAVMKSINASSFLNELEEMLLIDEQYFPKEAKAPIQELVMLAEKGKLSYFDLFEGVQYFTQLKSFGDLRAYFPFVLSFPVARSLDDLDLTKTFTHFLCDVEITLKPKKGDGDKTLSPRDYGAHDGSHAVLLALSLKAQNKFKQILKKELLQGRILDFCLNSNDEALRKINYNWIHEQKSGFSSTFTILETLNLNRKDLETFLRIDFYKHMSDESFKETARDTLIENLTSLNPILRRKAIVELNTSYDYNDQTGLRKIKDIFIHALQSNDRETALSILEPIKYIELTAEDAKVLLDSPFGLEILKIILKTNRNQFQKTKPITQKNLLLEGSKSSNPKIKSECLSALQFKECEGNLLLDI